MVDAAIDPGVTRFSHIKPQHHDKVIAYAMLLGVEPERADMDVDRWHARFPTRNGVQQTMYHRARITAVCWALHHMGWFVTSDGEITRDGNV